MLCNRVTLQEHVNDCERCRELNFHLNDPGCDPEVVERPLLFLKESGFDTIVANY